MPSEGPPRLKQKSLESLKEIFKQRLDAILDMRLTVENIETFADEALSETVKLTEEILVEYRRNPEVHARPTTLDTKAQEDEAFAILGLPNINEVLQSINEVKDSIESLKTYIHANAESVDTVITPPQPDYPTEVKEGTGGFEKRMFPRLLTLLYIIEHDFDLQPTDVHITQGTVTPQMMRQTPYVRVQIPKLDRAVYICDEEGNASYVFDTEKITEQGLTLSEIDVDDKGDKNSLIAYHPRIGIRIIQSPNWRSRVALALGEAIPEIETGIPEKHEKEERERRSEFREKREWLPFEDFRAEVKKFYKGQENVKDWYDEEIKNHPDWPILPYYNYKHKGWVGWPELVGKENPKKKDFLFYLNFQTEVRSFYQDQKNIARWYRMVRNDHSNWPANPDDFYKGNGWTNWQELVRIEKYLSYTDFERSVRSFYTGQNDVQRWYKIEWKNHPNWPSHPQRIYKDFGWVGFPELVGKENLRHKEWLTFAEFQDKVRSHYPGKGNAFQWYKEEQKKHPNWPSNPERIYKNKGWTSWPDIVGKKKT